MNIIKPLLFLMFLWLLSGCGIYSFTGGNLGDAKTFQVRMFRNNAPIVEPGLDRDFTNALQDFIQNQTNLTLTNKKADLIYEGEITEFSISPMTAQSNQTAAENRFKMDINVRFFNNTDTDADFEKKFSFFSDFPATTQFVNVKEDKIEEVFDRITQDIFNDSLANW